MKMNNDQGKMDAQDALPPLSERVDQQLPHLWGFSLHPRLDLNPSCPGRSGRLSCTPTSEITSLGLYLDLFGLFELSHKHN